MSSGSPRNWQNAAVVITGGGSGVGAACAVLWAAEGARVLLVGRGEDKLRAVCEQTGASYLCGDVGESDFCARVGESVAQQFGRWDALINNAGIIRRGDSETTSDDDWTTTMRTNLDGAFYMSRAAMAQMRRQKSGAIVNVGSTAGLVGVANLSAYCASKGGVSQLTRALALEGAADGITVNAVAPGAIDAPMLYSEHAAGTTAAEVRARNEKMIPCGRLATAAEVARAILFLAGEPHITGAMLPVDGGYTAQ